MKEVNDFLKENGSGYLATVDNGVPRVRPWGFMFEEEGKYYFCTSIEKNVYKQLQTVPYIEFTATSKNFTWLRLSGKIKFTEDIQIKEKILETAPMVKGIYKSADNPIFTAFYLEHGTANFSDFSGQPPRKFEF